MSSAAGPAQPVTSIVSMTKVNDMAELQLADVFVEMADTLVDEFDLIDFLHVLTERCVETVRRFGSWSTARRWSGNHFKSSRIVRTHPPAGVVPIASRRRPMSRLLPDPRAGVHDRPDID